MRTHELTIALLSVIRSDLWQPLDQLREWKVLAGPYASEEEAQRIGLPQVES